MDRFLRPFAFFHPDDPAGADPNPGAVDLDAEFGGLESSEMPQLGLDEAEYKQAGGTEAPEAAQTEPKPTPKGPEETATPEDEASKKADEAAREAATGEKADEKTGKDPDSPGEDARDLIDEKISGIADKYRGQPRGVVFRDMKELQKLQNETAVKNKGLASELEQLSNLVDSHFERGENGKFILRPEAAARAMEDRSKQGLRGLPPDLNLTEDAIRREVETEYRKTYAETVDEDDMPEFMERSKPMIDKIVADRQGKLRSDRDAFFAAQMGQMGNAVQDHLRANPHHDTEEIRGAVNAMYDKMPADVLWEAIVGNDERGGFFPVAEAFELAHYRLNYKQGLRNAYLQALKDNGIEPQPKTGGEPGSPPTPPKSKGDRSEEDAYADAIMKAGQLPSFEDVITD